MLQQSYPSPYPVPTSAQSTLTAAPSNEPARLNQKLDLNEDQDQTDHNTEFVESYVDFSEYYKAIETFGEDYVANTVQL